MDQFCQDLIIEITLEINDWNIIFNRKVVRRPK